MWLVFNIGCIECGVSSNVVAIYPTEQEANAVAEKLNEVHSWREGGQNSYEVFELNKAYEVSDEYKEILLDGETK
nr:MAG TPA: hypothetical protein [Bacteriophage sp.]